MNAEDLIATIKKEIDKICRIYPTVGKAMFDEPRNRLALAIAKAIEQKAKQ